MEKLKQSLETKGYQVSIFENKELAAAYLNSQIDQKIVGLGGSVTIHQMDLYTLLSEHNTVYWHDKKPENMTVMETRTAAARGDIYISSVNGISENGEIVNIDNTGIITNFTAMWRSVTTLPPVAVRSASTEPAAVCLTM